MGYFANSTEGELYYQRFCCRCVHDGDGGDCAVWLAHLLHSYEECDNPESILGLLIPRSGLENEQCRMFVQKEDPHA